MGSEPAPSGRTRFTVELDIEVVREFRVAVVKRHGVYRGFLMREIEEALRIHARRLVEDQPKVRAPQFGAR